MAEPFIYTPTYSYSGYQASNPTRPLPAPKVDNDFAKISQSTSEIALALRDIRRSDGKLQNGLVTIASLESSLSALIAAVPGLAAAAAVSAANAATSAGSAAVSAASAESSAGVATAAAQHALENATGLVVATQAQAEAGVLNDKGMTPLRTLQSIIANRHVFDVRDYGAKGDGVTNDTVAFQTAAALAIAGRGELYIPAGIYKVAAPIFTNCSVPLSVRGDGAHSSCIKYDPSAVGDCMSFKDAFMGAEGAGMTDPAVNFFDPANFKTGVRLSGFSILGDRATANSQSGVMFYGKCDCMALSDLYIMNIKGGGLGLGQMASGGVRALAREGEFNGVWVRKCGDYANGRYAVEILSSDMANTDDSTNNLTFVGLRITWSDGGYGLLMKNTRSNNSSRYIYFYSCFIENTGSGGAPGTQFGDMIVIQGAHDDIRFSGEFNGVRDGFAAVKTLADPTYTSQMPTGIIFDVTGGPNDNLFNFVQGRDLYVRLFRRGTTGFDLIAPAGLTGPVTLEYPNGFSGADAVKVSIDPTQLLNVRVVGSGGVYAPWTTEKYSGYLRVNSTSGTIELIVKSNTNGTRSAFSIDPTNGYFQPTGIKLSSGTPANTPGALAREDVGGYVTVSTNYGGPGAKRVAYGTIPPSTGTWRIGDRCYNSSPAVGQPKSWVCTVAGTPGTWVSEGNL